jgi:hypothetical protein
MDFVFDKNVLEASSNSQIQDFSVKTKSKTWNAYVAPITLIEIFSHITDEAPETYQKAKSLLRKVLILTAGRQIPEGEAIIAVPLGVNYRSKDLSPLWSAIKVALEFNSFREAIQGKIVSWNHTPIHIKLTSDYIHQFRQQYESNWLMDIANHVINTVFKDGKVNPKSLSEDQKRQIRSFLNSDSLARQILIALKGRVLGRSVNELVNVELPEPIDELKHRFCAVIGYYARLIEQILLEKYAFISNKNDYNDFLLTLYTVGDIHLVSNDKRLKQRIPDSCSQKKLIHTIDEYLRLFD